MWYIFLLHGHPNEYSNNIVQYNLPAVFSSLRKVVVGSRGQGKEYKLNSTLLDRSFDRTRYQNTKITC